MYPCASLVETLSSLSLSLLSRARRVFQSQRFSEEKTCYKNMKEIDKLRVSWRPCWLRTCKDTTVSHDLGPTARRPDDTGPSATSSSQAPKVKKTPPTVLQHGGLTWRRAIFKATTLYIGYSYIFGTELVLW